MKIPAIAQQMDSIYVKSKRDLEFRRLGGHGLLQPFFEGHQAPANSDYYPLLDQQGARIRFRGSGLTKLVALNHNYFNLANVLELYHGSFNSDANTDNPHLVEMGVQSSEATLLRDFFLDTDASAFPNLTGELRENAVALVDICSGRYMGKKEGMLILYEIGRVMLPYLYPAELEQVIGQLALLGAEQNLTGPEYSLFSLFRSFGTLDGQVMRKNAMQLRRGGRNIPEDVSDFLVASALIGFLLENDPQGAERLWQEYSKKRFGAEPLSPFFSILNAQIEDRMEVR